MERQDRQNIRMAGTAVMTLASLALMQWSFPLGAAGLVLATLRVRSITKEILRQTEQTEKERRPTWKDADADD